MPLDAASIAAAVGATAENKQFKASAENVPRKILIIGTYDPLKTGVVDEVPVLVTSPEDAGNQFGFGFPVHRMAIAAFAGSGGVETWIQPQSEVAGSQAVGSITITGPATEAGTIYLYVAGDAVPVTVASADTDAVIATAIAAAINADDDLPITASAALGVVTTTAKDTSTYGDGVDMSLNWGFQQETPAGVTVVIVQQTGGAGVPVMADALSGLGTGDAANSENFTDVCHTYGQDTTSMDSLSTYNGAGNVFTGLYAKTVGRPFRVLDGDTTIGSAALTTLKALGDGRKLDRTNGIIAVPASPDHPSEIGAVAIGVMAKTNNNVAAESFIGKTLPNVIPGPTDGSGDRWTDSYDARNSALTSGISPTHIKNGAVTMQNVATFYHPDGVSVASNCYRSQRNISIIQNFLFNIRQNFEGDKWQGIIIVADVAKVTTAIVRQKTRDRKAVLGDLLALTESFEGHAWIYSASFTISQLQSDASLVTIRVGGDGFNIFLPLVLSGEGGIFDTVAQVDASLAVFLN
jgi:phage tail sheath gpL-like